MNTNSPQELADLSAEILTIAEASAINKVMTAPLSDQLKAVIAEAICNEYGWFHQADPDLMDFTGNILRDCALRARGEL